MSNTTVEINLSSPNTAFTTNFQNVVNWNDVIQIPSPNSTSPTNDQNVKPNSPSDYNSNRLLSLFQKRENVRPSGITYKKALHFVQSFPTDEEREKVLTACLLFHEKNHHLRDLSSEIDKLADFLPRHTEEEFQEACKKHETLLVNRNKYNEKYKNVNVTSVRNIALLALEFNMSNPNVKSEPFERMRVVYGNYTPSTVLKGTHTLFRKSNRRMNQKRTEHMFKFIREKSFWNTNEFKEAFTL